MLLTAHLGNWEIGGLMLAQVKQPIHVVLVPDIFPGVERERRRLHARSGVVEIRVDGSFVPTLSVMRALNSNGIVAMQGDRDFDNTGVAVPFFGREAFFPRGPLRVAMASGATVLPAFIVRVPDGRYRAVVEEPLEIRTSGDRDAALAANLRRYVAILERYVRQYPDQWYCFYPFWDDPTRRAARRRTLRLATRTPNPLATANGLAAAGLPRRHRRHEERVVVTRERLDVGQDRRVLEAGGGERVRQFAGVRKPWFGRVAGSVATPVKFSRKLNTNST